MNHEAKYELSLAIIQSMSFSRREKAGLGGTCINFVLTDLTARGLSSAQAGSRQRN